MENEALLIIDYTNDFVDDKGALTCGAPAQALAGQIVSLADQFLAAGKWVILASGSSCQPTSTLRATPTTRKPSSSHPTICQILGAGSSTDPCKLGIINIKTTSTSLSWTSHATLPSALPAWTSSCASARSARFTWPGSARTSASCIPPWMPTTMATTLRCTKRQLPL